MPNIVVSFQGEFAHCVSKGRKSIYPARSKCCPSCSSKHENKICIMDFHLFQLFSLQDLVDYSHLTPVQSISLGHKVYCKFSTDFTGLQLISTQLISLDFNLSHWIAAYFTGMQYISLDLRVLHWIDQ